MTKGPGEKLTKRRPTRPLAVRVVGLALLAAAISFLWWRFGPVSQRNRLQGKISATGTIEATEVDVSAEVGGQIERLLVDEGSRVERGQLVAKIEDSQMEAELLRAEAVLESVRAVLGDLEAGARSEELERARARVKLARATLALAESDWQRAAELFDGGVFSENQRDNARASLDVARGQYDAAVEELKLLQAGSRPDQIKAARWEVKQAEAALRLAEVRLGKTEIYAPISGIVLVKDSEEGEVILPGVPVVTIADLEDMWVKIYIDEVQIGSMRLGQHARVWVDSFPEKEFSGKVTYVSDEAEFTPKNIQTREDRVKLVFAVKVGIDNAGGLLKPGMYADIELEAMSPE
ncbi:MAG: efflux RND transporter periplasmic adaptor subunit [Candidatus Hydrogenedentota bacterium]|nr:MAG: efflux RND transporter periplasmic adaptor subunit [Candidatus Hydrogenedentota bacterium]